MLVGLFLDAFLVKGHKAPINALKGLVLLHCADLMSVRLYLKENGVPTTDELERMYVMAEKSIRMFIKDEEP